MAKKILLAEDSVTMQKVVEMTFAAEGYSVTAVGSGEAAITQAKEVKPDIVIADLSMEGKTGYEVSSALKADPALARIPVLLLHGTAAPYDEAKARVARADGEIVKPFETQAMIDKVRTLIEKASAGAREPMRPAESLATPLTSGPDILIDADALEMPARPAAPTPAPAPARPAPVPPPARPVPAAKPAPLPAAPPPPVKPKPAAEPLAQAKSAPPKPAAPVVPAAKPLSAALKAAVQAKAESAETEITIEAEPPPRGAGHVAWDRFDAPVGPAAARPAPAPTVEPVKARKPDGTLLGLGKPQAAAAPRPDLPPPPPGMPLPSAVGKTPAPAAADALDPAAYEAIAKLSREIIERIVWEVVPDLAERIIREELDRLVEKRRSS